MISRKQPHGTWVNSGYKYRYHKFSGSIFHSLSGIEYWKISGVFHRLYAPAIIGSHENIFMINDVQLDKFKNLHKTP